MIVLFLILALLLILKKHSNNTPIINSRPITPSFSLHSASSIDSSEMNNEEDFSSIQTVRKHPRITDASDTPQSTIPVNVRENSPQESEITPLVSNEEDSPKKLRKKSRRSEFVWILL